MEQIKIINTNNSNYCFGGEFGGEWEKVRSDHLGIPIHSQVRKIKQEFEKIKHTSPPQVEIRPVPRVITRQSSPLGRVRQPISVGDS